MLQIPSLVSRPRELSNDTSRDVSSWPILACFCTDLSCLGPERVTYITSSDSEYTVSEALGRPLGRSLATRPEADASLLGELSVVVEICPQREHDLWDAGARRWASVRTFVIVSNELCCELTKYSRGNLPRLRASRVPRYSPSPSAQTDQRAATASL